MRKVIVFVTVILFFRMSFCLAQQEESITITTYYPSPHGEYNELQTNKFAVGDTNESGGLDAGDQPDANGQLYTARSVIYKPQSSLPTSDTKEGELIYNISDKQLYVYKGATDGWQPIGGGGACPSGFTDTGYGYCIQTNENSARNWYSASDYCADTYNARLCTSSEWYNACINGKANGMTGNWEWVISWGRALYSGNGDEDYAGLVRGGGGCSSVFGPGTDDLPFPFRCCRCK